MIHYRVADVLREMESIQKREAEDTAALENMVQQVEANLTETTVSIVYYKLMYFVENLWYIYHAMEIFNIPILSVGI